MRALLVLTLVLSAAVSRAERPTLSGPEQLEDGEWYRIHYTTEGDDAVALDDAAPADGVLDYIGWVVSGLETMRAYAIDARGWRLPYPDLDQGGDARIDVYVRVIDAFGYAHYEGAAGEDGAYAYLELNPANGVFGHRFARSVAGHELHHAIQVAYTRYGDSWFYETTATYFQMLAYDLLYESTFIVNTLLEQRFGEVQRGLVSTGERFDYANGIWLMFLEERFADPTLARSIWEAMSVDPDVLAATDQVLQAHASSLAEAFAEFTEWNWFACTHDDGAHYADAAYCTTSFGSVRTAATAIGYPFEHAPPAGDEPEPLGANYLRLVNDGTGDALAVAVSGAGTLGLRLIAQRADCTSLVLQASGEGSVALTLEGLGAFREVVAIVQNLAWTGGSLDYALTATMLGEPTPAPPAPSRELLALELHPAVLAMDPGERRQLTALATYGDCTRLNATTSASTTWDTSAGSVAQLGFGGEVLAVSDGIAELTATRRGMTSAPSVVTVGTPRAEPGDDDDDDHPYPTDFSDDVDTCGCGPSGGVPALAWLLLLALFRRRR